MASRSSNRAAVPEAKGALDKFKYEVANELGVPLSDGYNGDLTSKQNGSQAERISRRIYGQENDRAAGKTDGRQITSAFSSNRRKASGIDLDAFFC